MSPIISILIIAHNEENHIRECIESALGQSMKADEILLIAHNCTDRTVNIAQEYNEIQVHEYLSEEIGPIAAREY